MTDSPNLALPFIEGGEMLPNVTLNEALRVIDALVQLAVADRDLNAPPGSPTDGQRWIVKASPSPTGAWAGHGNHVAAWQDGAWAFSVPKPGWLAFVADEGALVAWNGSAWVAALDVIGGITTLQNLVLLGVGTAADATNPLSAKLNNALWTAKTVAEGGDGHLRYKMSKESAAKTLSLLMQTNFSGRAEVGLTGDDDLHVKVSADGSSWLDAIMIDRTTGKLAFGQGFSAPATARAQLYAAPFDALAFNGLQVNGGMEISQEKGAALWTPANGNYLADGWTINFSGTMVLQAQQVTDAPPGYNNSLKVTVTTAQASLGAADYVFLEHAIEGYRSVRLKFGHASASAVAVGFWVKAHRTGLYSGEISANAGRSNPFEFTVNVSDTWEFKTFTISGDVTGTWLTTTGKGLRILIALAVGTAYQGTPGVWSGSTLIGATGSINGVAATSDTFQITGLIVLPGVEVPSDDRAPYIMRPIDQELTICSGTGSRWRTIPGARSYSPRAKCARQRLRPGRLHLRGRRRCAPLPPLR